MTNKLVGIYLIQIGKYNYVGKSINIKSRISKHKSSLKLNRHENSYIQNVYNKYKEFEYKILWIGCKELLQIMEQHYINWFSNSLNIREASNNVMTKQHKESISKAHKSSKLVQASVKRALKIRQTEGEYLSKEKQSKNRKDLSELFNKRYYVYSKFVFYKKDKVIVATVFEFCMITGINKRTVEQLINHRTNYCYGWQLSAIAVVKEGELLES